MLVKDGPSTGCPCFRKPEQFFEKHSLILVKS